MSQTREEEEKEERKQELPKKTWMSSVWNELRKAPYSIVQRKGIEKEYCAKLIQHIQNNSTVEKFGLDHLLLTDDAWIEIFQTITKYDTKIHEIAIDNLSMGIDAWKALGELIQTGRIKNLHIGRDNGAPNKDGIQWLMKVMEDNTRSSVTKLRFFWTNVFFLGEYPEDDGKMTSDWSEPLAEMIKKTKKLKDLYFCYTRFYKMDMVLFADALKVNQSIECLSMEDLPCKVEEWEILVKALEENRTIREFVYEKNYIDIPETILTKIQQAIQPNIHRYNLFLLFQSIYGPNVVVQEQQDREEVPPPIYKDFDNSGLCDLHLLRTVSSFM